MQDPKILVFAGSIRTGSHNARLAALATKVLTLEGGNVTRISLQDFPMPLYDGDVEAKSGPPEHAVKLKRMMMQHAGVFIASAEYNASLAPLLKNTIDWISRVREGTEPALAAFRNRIFALGAASPGRSGGMQSLIALRQVLAGIDAALSAGFRALKLDSVVIRGVNDDELIDLLEFGRNLDAEVRFIEYMDVGGATQWTRQRVFSRAAMLSCLEAHYGSIRTLKERGSDPAERFELPNGYRFGIIASTTTPFCGSCDRSRLTADGMWFLCLYAKSGLDLRRLLRGAASRPELESAIREAWSVRADRGAEERLALEERGPLASAAALRENPHLEMHTRGG